MIKTYVDVPEHYIKPLQDIITALVCLPMYELVSLSCSPQKGKFSRFQTSDKGDLCLVITINVNFKFSSVSLGNNNVIAFNYRKHNVLDHLAVIS